MKSILSAKCVGMIVLFFGLNVVANYHAKADDRYEPRPRRGCLGPTVNSRILDRCDDYNDAFRPCRCFHPDAPQNMLVKFTLPRNVQVRVRTAGLDDDSQLLDMFRFVQGAPYRIHLTGRNEFNDLEMYATVQVLPDGLVGESFFNVNRLMIEFTGEDIRQVMIEGRPLVKVIYLPDQVTKDEPGPEPTVYQESDAKSDPVHEARRLGTVLLIVRMSRAFSHHILPPPPPPPSGAINPRLFEFSPAIIR